MRPVWGPKDCDNWNGNDDCLSGANTWDFAASAENRRWQAPPRGAPGFKESFGNYSDLVGYADIQYNCSRTQAVVVVNAALKTPGPLVYTFNGGEPSLSNTFQVDDSFKSALSVKITTSTGISLELDPLNFIWQNAPLTAAQNTFKNGQKGAIAELYGWPWVDVGKECQFLGKAGYMGVKVWPPNEHVWTSDLYEIDRQFRPWYLVYQPVSYRLRSRSGTRDELRAMIQSCRAAGVRVYADAVVNHMAANGKDVQPHRTSDCSTYSGHSSTLGSPYFTQENTYLLNPQTGTRPTFEYPAVPYGPTDFHCVSYIDSYMDPNQVTKGYLVNLSDLNTEKPYVQDRIATFLVDLLSIGFSGYRLDAAKHIGPASMAAILGRVRRKMGGQLPPDFLVWLEVLMGAEEKHHLACNGGPHSWYTSFDTQLIRDGFTPADLNHVKIWSDDYPTTMPACGKWIHPPNRFAIQNDDHDQQSHGSTGRGMGDKGSVLIIEENVDKHRHFEVQLFKRTDADWHIKLVLSSYMFMKRGGNGFPDGQSDCKLYTGSIYPEKCLGVPKDQAYVEGACGYTMKEGGYTRVHRDLSIVNAMRKWVGLKATTAEVLGIAGCE
ncbi:glycoside hydrolase superfamily [Calycina marina]|uniref:Alpha-amylase n=1 Tax=Calycina marina TaxID=1763456 RepID=A0A9P8CH13_9HELO|nr:glycoside hydrolase superfamily [Calycina marina]